MDAFVACRTTLEDLSERAAAQGTVVSAATIAAHLTGQAELSQQSQDAIANAINARLAELAKAPTAPSGVLSRL